jgi:hypothetical protein
MINKFLQFLSLLFLGLLGIFMFKSIMDFFNIQYQYYGIYIVFTLCLVLLYNILPKQHRNIFV